MLLVTRLNGTQIYINAELIRFVEETPDTVITFMDQSKLVVADPAEVIVERYIHYRQRVNMPWKSEIITKSSNSEG